MTELERWMNDHPPLADALTAEETAELRAIVLARRPKLHALRGWRLAAAAAALCLVAAGAVVLGLFHPMSAANETHKLVQKYGEVLDEPLPAEINGRTVSVKALLRGEYGRLPGEVNEEVRHMAIGDDEVITCRPADLLKPELEGYRKELGDHIRQEEDVLSYALFPQVAMKFFEAREAKERAAAEPEQAAPAAAVPQAEKAEPAAPAAPAVRTLYVEDMGY